MAKFRIEKNKDFTVMSNHHLRNKDLTLKAKGLLSQMLSLPENWDYSLEGLSHINRESLHAIRTAVWELEKAGYVIRGQGRDAAGHMLPIEYIIYEQPHEPVCDFPTAGNPMAGFPIAGFPPSENPMQLNTKGLNTNQSITNQSIIHSKKEGSNEGDHPLNWYREEFRRKIEYDILCEDVGRDRLDEIIETMLEPFSIRQDVMSIGKEIYSTAAVRDRMMQLRSSHIQQVIAAYDENAGNIESPRKYLLALLYNAPRQMIHQYQNM